MGAIGDADNPTSTVQAKLALIAERLVGDTKVLILDEPTWGICDDIAFPMLQVVAETAHRRGVRLILISHNEGTPALLFHSHLHLALKERSGTTKVVRIDLRKSS